MLLSHWKDCWQLHKLDHHHLHHFQKEFHLSLCLLQLKQKYLKQLEQCCLQMVRGLQFFWLLFHQTRLILTDHPTHLPKSIKDVHLRLILMHLKSHLRYCCYVMLTWPKIWGFVVERSALAFVAFYLLLLFSNLACVTQKLIAITVLPSWKRWVFRQ